MYKCCTYHARVVADLSGGRHNLTNSCMMRLCKNPALWLIFAEKNLRMVYGKHFAAAKIVATSLDRVSSHGGIFT